ncbi:MAG: DUF5317 domain-containing protein [Actinomycetota bacterium]
MTLALVPLLLGFLSGLAHGGKLDNVARTRFRLPSLVFSGLGLQIGGEIVALFYPAYREGGRGAVTLGLSYLLVTAFVICNRRLPGAKLIAIGLALNLAVILSNQGMPVSLRAAQAARIEVDGYLQSALKHRLMGPDTRLWFLGDLIPVPGIHKIISIGDVILGAGIFTLMDALVRYRPKRLRSGSC